MPTPQPPQEYDQFLSGGEGVIHPPTPPNPLQTSVSRRAPALLLD